MRIQRTKRVAKNVRKKRHNNKLKWNTTLRPPYFRCIRAPPPYLSDKHISRVEDGDGVEEESQVDAYGVSFFVDFWTSTTWRTVSGKWSQRRLWTSVFFIMLYISIDVVEAMVLGFLCLANIVDFRGVFRHFPIFTTPLTPNRYVWVIERWWDSSKAGSGLFCFCVLSAGFCLILA